MRVGLTCEVTSLTKNDRLRCPLISSEILNPSMAEWATGIFLPTQDTATRRHVNLRVHLCC
jgi:hypothetical protein